MGIRSGVSMDPEGGAHQSITTPSIGVEWPGIVGYEPAFAIDVEWILLDCLAHLGRPDGRSAYLRRSTRPVDQTLAGVLADPAARERRRRQVLAGGYRLGRFAEPQVTIAAMGAAERLDGVGIGDDVVCITSARLLFQALRASQGRHDGPSWILEALFPAEKGTPLVTVLGHGGCQLSAAAAHCAMSWPMMTITTPPPSVRYGSMLRRGRAIWTLLLLASGLVKVASSAIPLGNVPLSWT